MTICHLIFRSAQSSGDAYSGVQAKNARRGAIGSSSVHAMDAGPFLIDMSESTATSSEHSLIQRLKRRDTTAMLEFYDRYGKLVYSVILRAVKDQAMAEDLTQEALLRVWNRIGTFNEEKGNLEGWLVTVARNRAFDYMRAVRNTPETVSANFGDREHPQQSTAQDNQAERIANQQAVRTALGSLSPDQRAVIELTHFEGMSQSEIARRLQKPLGTVKGLVRSALKSLRNVLVGADLA